MTISFVIAGDRERPVSDREALTTRSLSMAAVSTVAITASASDVKELVSRSRAHPRRV
jgi:hypothetical protein